MYIKSLEWCLAYSKQSINASYCYYYYGNSCVIYILKVIVGKNKETLEMKGKKEIKEEDKIMKNRKGEKKEDEGDEIEIRERMLEKERGRVKCGEEPARRRQCN